MAFFSRGTPYVRGVTHCVWLRGFSFGNPELGLSTGPSRLGLLAQAVIDHPVIAIARTVSHDEV